VEQQVGEVQRIEGHHSMKAMALTRIAPVTADARPLDMVDVPVPQPGAGEALVKVSACGVCHTELDEIEGRMAPPKLPLVLGHQVVGEVAAIGAGVETVRVGERVGVAWIYSACGECAACRRGDENLCYRFQATGRDVNGGYAEYMVAPAAFVYRIPPVFSDLEAAPLLCAGAIGYRSLRLAGLQSGRPLGLTGFGASAHLTLQLARHLCPQSPVFVFTRSPHEREFALHLGAAWAGDTSDASPQKLAAIIDTTPAWLPVVEALGNLAPGGRLVINAIRKEEADKDALLRLDYPGDLWMEKEIKSVANVVRRDVDEFLRLAAEIPVHPEVQAYSLDDANQALLDLKIRRIRGAKVLQVI
jgi:alcohol dehydrogenase, propanol-preferring